MPTSYMVADSLLAIDVGSVSTRAMLFDVVDGRYRFIASGRASTTIGAPYYNASEGVRKAIDDLHKITGRQLIDPDEQLIIPSNPEGNGVDSFVATISAGPPLTIVVVGLLEDVSLESARHLASTIYGGVKQVISLNDRRKPEERIDAILRLRPKLVLAAGGTENGASHSILKLLESIGLACYLLPKEQRPEVLFAGNQALKNEIAATLEGITSPHFAPNIRPTLDVEQLDGAQSQIAHLFSRIRIKEIPGVEELNSWAKGGLLPTATAFGRIIRFLSKVGSTSRGVLGIDIGASATTLAASFRGSLSLNVYPQFGLGEALNELLEHVPLNQITRWLAQDFSDEVVREYLYNKALYPSTIPVTAEELAIEQAIARQVMQSAIRSATLDSLPGSATHGEALLPLVDPILATGSVLTRAPSLAQCALMLLDGLQPTGVTTLVLDQNQIAPSLGVAASINPILTVQLLDSNSFLHLGTVISPVGKAKLGTPILRLKVISDSDHETNLEIKQGSLEVFPLPYGQTARLQLYPLHHSDIGMGEPGRGGSIRVMGGALGIIVDARGRPLVIPKDKGKRGDLFKRWLWSLGG